MNKLHARYLFDVHEWKKRIDVAGVLERLREDEEPCGPTGPVLIESSREKYFKHHDRPTPVPTDIFLLAKGEPPDRDVTKVGGLPYRPRGKPWPEGMTFLCQFRLTESKDITGDLPGDILLIFRDFDYADSYTYEWYDLGLKELIPAEEVPKSPEPFFVGWGVKHRTCDYREQDSFPDDFEFYAWGPIKVGGAGIVVPGVSTQDVRLTIAVSSITPPPLDPFPWVNAESSLGRECYKPDNTLKVGYPVGLIVWLDAKNDVHIWEFSDSVPEEEIDWENIPTFDPRLLLRPDEDE